MGTPKKVQGEKRIRSNISGSQRGFSATSLEQTSKCCLPQQLIAATDSISYRIRCLLRGPCKKRILQQACLESRGGAGTVPGVICSEQMHRTGVPRLHEPPPPKDPTEPYA